MPISSNNRSQLIHRIVKSDKDKMKFIYLWAETLYSFTYHKDEIVIVDAPNKIVLDKEIKDYLNGTCFE